METREHVCAMDWSLSISAGQDAFGLLHKQAFAARDHDRDDSGGRLDGTNVVRYST